MSPLQNPEVSMYRMPAMEVADPADVVAAAEQIARQSIIAEQQPGYVNVDALAAEQGIALTPIGEVTVNQFQTVEALQPQYNAQADRAAAVQDARNHVYAATTPEAQGTAQPELAPQVEVTPEYLLSRGTHLEMLREAAMIS